MDKNSQNIVQNIFFCAPHVKTSNSGMEQHAIELMMTIFSFIGELVKILPAFSTILDVK